MKEVLIVLGCTLIFTVLKPEVLVYLVGYKTALSIVAPFLLIGLLYVILKVLGFVVRLALV